MEIYTRKQLKFYILADRMMNRGTFRLSIRDRLFNMIIPDYIMNYLVAMRKLSYYTHKKNSKLTFLLRAFYRIRYQKLGERLGYSIGYDTCGYGLVLPHYGTLIIGNRLGNFCVIHTLTNITNNGKLIGDGLYLSTGAVITSPIRLGDNISIGANSVVNKSFEQNNIMIAGAPAKYIKDSLPWYVRDGEQYQKRVSLVQNIRSNFNYYGTQNKL